VHASLLSQSQKADSVYRSRLLAFSLLPTTTTTVQTMATMIFNLPEEDGRPQIYHIDPKRNPRMVVHPQIFHGRTEPILIEFMEPPPPPPPPPCPCCAARQLSWRKARAVAGALVAVLLIGLLCRFAPRAYEFGKAFASVPRTTHDVAPVVVAPVPTNLFAFDGDILARSMTPARLNATQGDALFRLLSMAAEPVAPPVVEEDSADSCATDLCQILEAARPFLSVVARATKQYLPAFFETYLLEDDADKNDDASSQPMDYFDWVINVDKAVFEGITPAFLPSGGPITEESASVFYEMTSGHTRKVKKYESDVESALNSLFVLDSHLLENAMTPARLTEVQGQAFSDLFGPVEDTCCPMDDILCRLSAVAPKYVPEFLQTYLFGQPHDDNSSNGLTRNFAWMTTVWNHAIYRDTTPAFLPGGPTDSDSGISFYQLTQGASRNPDPDAEYIEMRQFVEGRLTACAETDSLSAIARQVKYFTPNTKASQKKAWYIQTPPADSETFTSDLMPLVDARFREMPAIHWDYHLQGTVLYEKMKTFHDFELTCAALWAEHPALRPTTLWEKLFRSFFFGKARIPTIRRRSCTDLSPASGGVDPVEVGQCHAYARDPEPGKPSEKVPSLLEWDVRHKLRVMPHVDETCHARGYLKYDFLQQSFDFSTVCKALWAKHPHTKGVRYRRDNSEAVLHTEVHLEPFNQLALQNFCLSLDLDRSRDKWDPNRHHGQMNVGNPGFFGLIYSD